MIDFTFTDEQEMFRKASREFAENRVAPFVPEMEKTGKVPPDLVKALAEAEMLAITVPEEYGGLGLGFVAQDDRSGGDRPCFFGHGHDAPGFCPWD